MLFACCCSIDGRPLIGAFVCQCQWQCEGLPSEKGGALALQWSCVALPTSRSVGNEAASLARFPALGQHLVRLTVMLTKKALNYKLGAWLGAEAGKTLQAPRTMSQKLLVGVHRGSVSPERNAALCNTAEVSLKPPVKGAIVSCCKEAARSEREHRALTSLVL